MIEEKESNPETPNNNYQSEVNKEILKLLNQIIQTQENFEKQLDFIENEIGRLKGLIETIQENQKVE